MIDRVQIRKDKCYELNKPNLLQLLEHYTNYSNFELTLRVIILGL